MRRLASLVLLRNSRRRSRRYRNRSDPGPRGSVMVTIRLSGVTSTCSTGSWLISKGIAAPPLDSMALQRAIGSAGDSSGFRRNSAKLMMGLSLDTSQLHLCGARARGTISTCQTATIVPYFPRPDTIHYGNVYCDSSTRTQSASPAEFLPGLAKSRVPLFGNGDPVTIA